jgi:hypothetical protein
MDMLLACAASSAGTTCPPGTTLVDGFSAEGLTWAACEDLSTPGGGLTLIPESGPAVHLPKSYEPYSPEPDDAYYLGLGKQTVLKAKWDMLGDAILHQCEEKTPTTGLCEPTWRRVERAVPVMRYSQGNKHASGNQFMCSPYSPESGVRTFTGSRSSSVDATFSDHADDCTDNGFPRPQGYVMNLTAIANGEPPVADFLKYVDFASMAEGLVGGGDGYPNLIFYFPLLPQHFSGFGGSRYWTMIASPVPDMQGGRQQSVRAVPPHVVIRIQGACPSSPPRAPPGLVSLPAADLQGRGARAAVRAARQAAVLRHLLVQLLAHHAAVDPARDAGQRLRLLRQPAGGEAVLG